MDIYIHIITDICKYVINIVTTPLSLKPEHTYIYICYSHLTVLSDSLIFLIFTCISVEGIEFDRVLCGLIHI